MMTMSEFPLIQDDAKGESNGGKLWAIKQVSKYHVLKYDKSESVQREKEILYALKGSPYVINLHITFQVGSSLFNVLYKIG